jgi:hypothetical protein
MNELHSDWNALLELNRIGLENLASKLLISLESFVNAFDLDKDGLTTVESRNTLESALDGSLNKVWASAPGDLFSVSDDADEKSDTTAGLTFEDLSCINNPCDEKEFVEYGNFWVPRFHDNSIQRLFDQTHVTSKKEFPLIHLLMDNINLVEAIYYAPRSLSFLNIVSSAFHEKFSESQASTEILVQNLFDDLKKEFEFDDIEEDWKHMKLMWEIYNLSEQ